MPHRIQITLTDEQYAFLDDEANLQSLSIAELIRRAVDTTFGLLVNRKVLFIRHTQGRRPGLPLDEAGL